MGTVTPQRAAQALAAACERVVHDVSTWPEDWGVGVLEDLHAAATGIISLWPPASKELRAEAELALALHRVLDEDGELSEVQFADAREIAQRCRRLCGQLWHHAGREIWIRRVDETSETLPLDWPHYICEVCNIRWVDIALPQISFGAMIWLSDCPADLARDLACSERHPERVRTLAPEEVLAGGTPYTIALTEAERRALIARFLRSPAALEALSEWACDFVYRLDATWPDDQITHSLSVAAAALAGEP